MRRILTALAAAFAASFVASCTAPGSDSPDARPSVRAALRDAEPAEVSIGAAGSARRVATVSGAKALLDEAAEDAAAKLVDATNMAVKAKLPSIGEASAQGSTEYQGVRLGVYGQNDYYLAETSFITNYVEDVVTGAVDDMNEAVLNEYLKRRTLSDRFIRGTGQLVDNYVWEYDVDVLDGHVGLETQMPIGVMSVATNGGFESEYRYFRITNTAVTVVPPFTVYGRYVKATDPEFLSKPGLFFIPYTTGVYTARCVDLNPPANVYDGADTEGMFAEITVTKSTSSTIRTIDVDSLSSRSFGSPRPADDQEKSVERRGAGTFGEPSLRRKFAPEELERRNSGRRKNDGL